MLIKYIHNNETVKIENRDILLKYLESGELKYNTVVYDSESGEYKKLIDIDEIKELGLIPEYNQYLNIDIKVLNHEKKRKRIAKHSDTTLTAISLILLILALLKNIISYYFVSNIVSSGNSNSFIIGQMLGQLIGKSLIGIFIWYAIWKWTQKSRKKYFLIIYSIVFLLVTLVSLF